MLDAHVDRTNHRYIDGCDRRMLKDVGLRGGAEGTAGGEAAAQGEHRAPAPLRPALTGAFHVDTNRMGHLFYCNRRA